MKKTALIMIVILMMMSGCRQSKSVPCNEVQQNSEYSDSIEAEAMEKWDSLHDSCFVEGLNGNETKDSFTVIYRQPVNGYKVQALVKKEEQRIGLVADLTFTKGDKSFTLYTTSFGDTVFNKGGWGMDGTNDELMEKYRRKTVEADYHENRDDGETMSGHTPFFFSDLDFDGVDELVIVHYSIAERYHSG